MRRIMRTDAREPVAMQPKSERNPESNPPEVEEHIRSAHQILKSLQEKIGVHPEIGDAIAKLEMALNVLAVKTGGVL
jgi:hypothetical protein